VAALRSAVKVAELGSVTRAAAALRLAQPAVSRQIHALERELGRALFARRGRGLVLTPFGREVVFRGANALRQLETLEGLSQRYAGTKLVVA
jgi:DNA-binding transcriptional LysR family regulator